jgi:hypothetical protein
MHRNHFDKDLVPIESAIKRINAEMRKIVYEGPDDMGAMEWEGHLYHVKGLLMAGEISVKGASDSLGINLD